MPYVNGGAVGYLLGFIFQKYVGLLGTYLFLVLSSLVSTLIIINLGLRDLGSLLKNIFYAPAPKPAAVPSPNRGRERVVHVKDEFAPDFAPVAPPPVKLEKRQGKNNKQNFVSNLKKIFDGSDDEDDMKVIVPVRERQKTDPSPTQILARPLTNNDNYKIPPLSLLNAGSRGKENSRALQQQVDQDKLVLETTLRNFNVEAKVVNVSHGPAVTRYELMPAPGVRVNKIANLSNDISLAMAATVRIEAPVPGKSVVGIEIPNRYTRPVYLSELTENEDFVRSPLTVALGLDIGGAPVYSPLNEMPHLLIAGATGSGKSVCINSIIMSILLKATPAEVNFLMIDPKRVELQPFNEIPHLVAPVVHEPQLAQVVLKTWAIKEMETRYKIFANVGVKNIEGYNAFARRQHGKTIMMKLELNGEDKQVPFVVEHMPYTVIIIDELADLMMVASREVEGVICRLAQMARATGIHLVIATQRPSVDVITGLIKANVPSRIAFAVGSQIDSRTIIDGMGAETLLGKGDMLYSPVGARHLRRVQGVYVSETEVNKVTSFIRCQARPMYRIDLEGMEREAVQKKNGNGNSAQTANQRDDGRDVLFDDAAQLLQGSAKKSISYIQRRFRIGYNRAARIMDELIEAGVVNPQQ
jgi:S-DNA-T family DNA segregation ATPase FtsK/SpoIIIE